MKTIKLFLFLICSLFFSNVKAQQADITIETKRNDDKSVTFSYKKQNFGTYHLWLWFTSLENAYSKGYFREVRGPGGQLFTLKPENREQGISLSYKYRYVRGELKPEFDPNYVYFLPVALHKETPVFKMYNVNEQYFGAEKPKNWVSFQFSVQPGDTVFAARKGLVVAITEDKDYNTEFEISYQSNINSILVEHGDGTLAKYEGFEKLGVFVEEGQTVYPRTPLGTISKYDNREQGQLRFSAYYLDYIEKEENANKSLKDRISPYAYIDPMFLTDNGIMKLEARKSYKAVWDNDLMQKELTKRERKNLLKLQR